jgi:hypothetical protein
MTQNTGEQAAVMEPVHKAIEASEESQAADPEIQQEVTEGTLEGRDEGTPEPVSEITPAERVEENQGCPGLEEKDNEESDLESKDDNDDAQEEEGNR